MKPPDLTPPIWPALIALAAWLAFALYVNLKP